MSDDKPSFDEILKRLKSIKTPIDDAIQIKAANLAMLALKFDIISAVRLFKVEEQEDFISILVYKFTVTCEEREYDVLRYDK
jgi:hypothetical protein